MQPEQPSPLDLWNETSSASSSTLVPRTQSGRSSREPCPPPRPDERGTVTHRDARSQEDRRLDAIDQMDLDSLPAFVRSLPAIEQSKGMLMALYEVDSSTAFKILRRWSSTRDIKIGELAAALVSQVAVSPRARGARRTDAPIGEGLRAYLARSGLP